MNSCPKELIAYDKAHKEKLIEQDKMIHLWIGSYGLSALSVAIEHCMQGQKAKSKYIERPIFAEEKNEKKKNSNEVIAVYEMKQRTKLIEKMGLPQSPK